MGLSKGRSISILTCSVATVRLLNPKLKLSNPESPHVKPASLKQIPDSRPQKPRKLKPIPSYPPPPPPKPTSTHQLGSFCLIFRSWSLSRPCAARSTSGLWLRALFRGGGGGGFRVLQIITTPGAHPAESIRKINMWGPTVNHSIVGGDLG